MRKLLAPVLTLLLLCNTSCRILNLFPAKTPAERQEARAAQKLHRHSQEIQKLIHRFPQLADSTKQVVRDSLKTQSDSARTAVKLATDSSAFNTRLRSYVVTQERLKFVYLQAATDPAAKREIAELLRQRSFLQESLQAGAFKEDSVYTYEDRHMTVTAQLKQGKLLLSYVTKGKWVLYDKEVIQLGLHDCPPDKFYSHREFWFANLIWFILLIVVAFVLKIFR